jgi:hypothetical protein
VSEPPKLIDLGDAEGADTAERWRVYLEALYGVWQRTLVYGGLSFRGRPLRCRKTPESRFKHFGFWHLIQEGFPEEERMPDLERCRRLLWVGWVIQNEGIDRGIRLILQTPRHGEKKPWALWLHEHDYAVVVAERDEYCLLKTAFVVHARKKAEFERDWQAGRKGRKD